MLRRVAEKIPSPLAPLPAGEGNRIGLFRYKAHDLTILFCLKKAVVTLLPPGEGGG